MLFHPISAHRSIAFLVRFHLKQQTVLSGSKQLNLQSGMGVSANIKLRSRPVISIVSDLFTKQLDGASASASRLIEPNFIGLSRVRDVYGLLSAIAIGGNTTSALISS